MKSTTFSDFSFLLPVHFNMQTFTAGLKIREQRHIWSSKRHVVTRSRINKHTEDKIFKAKITLRVCPAGRESLCLNPPNNRHVRKSHIALSNNNLELPKNIQDYFTNAYNHQHRASCYKSFKLILPHSE